MYCAEVLNWPSCVENGVFLKWGNWNTPQVELCVEGVTWWRQRWRATKFTHTHTYVYRVLTSKWWCWVWEKMFPLAFPTLHDLHSLPFPKIHPLFRYPFFHLSVSVKSSDFFFFLSPTLFSFTLCASGFLQECLYFFPLPFPHPSLTPEEQSFSFPLLALWFNNLCEQKRCY